MNRRLQELARETNPYDIRSVRKNTRKAKQIISQERKRSARDVNPYDVRSVRRWIDVMDEDVPSTGSEENNFNWGNPTTGYTK